MYPLVTSSIHILALDSDSHTPHQAQFRTNIPISLMAVLGSRRDHMSYIDIHGVNAFNSFRKGNSTDKALLFPTFISDFSSRKMVYPFGEALIILYEVIRGPQFFELPKRSAEKSQ